MTAWYDGATRDERADEAGRCDVGDWVRDVEELGLMAGGGRPLREAVAAMTDEVLAEFWRFRVDFVAEELAELRAAATAEDALDALVDLCVVAIGTMEALGADVRSAWARVHAANMAKRPGANQSRPNRFGLPDLVKPDGWTPPDHHGCHGELTRVFGQAVVAAEDRP